MENKLMPLGTVIKTNKADAPFIIMGHNVTMNQTGEKHDYLCYLYPYGFLDREKNYIIDQTDVTEVLYKGFEGNLDELEATDTKYDLANELVPVGSIVSMRFNTEKFIVLGYGTVDSNTNNIYDYSLIDASTGLISLDNLVMCNRDMIRSVDYDGYVTDEYKKFAEDALNQIEELINK